MKHIKEYILEELDNNVWWLLDKWFERNENQYQEFVEIVIKCKQEGEKVNIDNLKKYYERHTFSDEETMRRYNLVYNRATEFVKENIE